MPNHSTSAKKFHIYFKIDSISLLDIIILINNIHLNHKSKNNVFHIVLLFYAYDIYLFISYKAILYLISLIILYQVSFTAKLLSLLKFFFKTNLYKKLAVLIIHDVSK